MLRKRVLTAVIGIPFLLLVFWRGGIIFALFLAGSIAIMLREYFLMLKNKGIQGIFWLSLLGGALFIFIPFWSAENRFGEVITFIVICAFLMQILFPLRYNFSDTAATVLGSLYIGGFFSHLWFLRDLSKGTFLVITLFIIVWLCDSGAFFAGLYFGRTKLAPKVSPKKTVEGALGGLVAGTIGALLANAIWLNYNFYHVCLLGACTCISAQLGDLAESIIKRNVGVKDSGNILPGHGGLLDRFDSILFSAPVFYYLVKYLF